MLSAAIHNALLAQHYKEEAGIRRLTEVESEWTRSIQGSGKFIYFSNPPSLVREVLEEVFGPLDYEIPYV